MNSIATAFSETHQYLDDDPTGTASDDYMIDAKVSDDDGGAGSGKKTPKLCNVNPVSQIDTLTNEAGETVGS